MAAHAKPYPKPVRIFVRYEELGWSQPVGLMDSEVSGQHPNGRLIQPRHRTAYEE